MIDWLRHAPADAAADPVVDLGVAVLPVAIRRHPRARRMTLRLAPDGASIKVTIPTWGRSMDALRFARSRSDWLAGQLDACAKPASAGHGTTIMLRGEPLRIDWSPVYPRNPHVEGALLRCGGPEDRIAARVQRWLERQALQVMRDDLALYCARASLPVPDLRLARARRRWGSCSSQGTVRINWRLIQAPDFVRQSVVAHEVAHLVHFDHSPQFHRLLSDLFGERLSEADRWLKREGRTLYAQFG